MRKRLIILTVLISICTYMSIGGIKVEAANSTSANKLLDKAISQKSFYYYNSAYKEILELDDENLKNSLLTKLNSISTEVWNEDIKRINQLLEEIVKDPNGKIYDETEAYISNSKISDVDKAYFLGELNTWGRLLVWTDDYKLATSKLTECYTELNKAVVSDMTTLLEETQEAINNIKNDGSRKYREEEFKTVKEKYKLKLSNIVIGEVEKLSDITVDVGTDISNISLPKKVTAILSNGSNVDIETKWDTTAYTKSTEGTYKLTASYELPTGVSGEKPEVSINVIVKYVPKNDEKIKQLFSGDVLIGDYEIRYKESGLYGSKDEDEPTVINGNLSIKIDTLSTDEILTLRNIVITGKLDIDAGFGKVILNNVTVQNANVVNSGIAHLNIKGDTRITQLIYNSKLSEMKLSIDGEAYIDTLISRYDLVIENNQNRNAIDTVVMNNTSSANLTLKGQFKTISMTKDGNVNVIGNKSEITNLQLNERHYVNVEEGSIIKNIEIKGTQDITIVNNDNSRYTNIKINKPLELTLKDTYARIKTDTKEEIIINAKGNCDIRLDSGNYKVNKDDKTKVTTD